MNIRHLTATAGLVLSFAVNPSWADVGSPTDAPASEFTNISLGGQDVPVVKGGLYDRYRSNPPLSIIEAEAPGVDLSWFKQLHKKKVDIGFESYSPNFYYQNSRIIFTADLDKLKALMPAKVLEQVQPLQVWRGPVDVERFLGLCAQAPREHGAGEGQGCRRLQPAEMADRHQLPGDRSIGHRGHLRQRDKEARRHA